uniref:Sushi domain-containing protein n=1 Tax=Clastoptera arizonana TaxID=38151 RepID=A0A1B6DSP0_9HEMI
MVDVQLKKYFYRFLRNLICLIVLFTQNNCVHVDQRNSSTSSINFDCFEFEELENGNVTIIDSNNIQALHVNCFPGYHLVGRPKYICNNDQWENVSKPKCVKVGCGDPPMLANGELKIEGYKVGEVYGEGIIAEYQCMPGFHLIPPSSKIRVCRDGGWSGVNVSCYSEGCSSPPPLINGYFVTESSAIVGPRYATNERLHYSCNVGYKLEGPSTIQCQVSGSWSPHVLPQCIRYPPELRQMCQPPPPLSHVIITVVRGLQSANTALSGTTLEASCENGFRDEHSPCVPQLLRCVDGSWEGRMPNCVPINGCIYPLSIPNANILNLQPHGHYPIGSSVAYSCLSGYDLVGDAIFRCKPNGCWDPEILPVCHPRQSSRFYINPGSWSEYLNLNTSLLISMVTAASVMFIILSVCIVVVCRHNHHPHHHHHHMPRGGASQTALAPPPPDPDRVALIAFAEGVQSVLPSYEEAIRGAGNGSVLNYRLHRPQWTMLGNQRNRTTRDSNFVSRQISSAGESMGSTDTMTVSEVSTNITLDTVSSHTCSSGSQTASCRAICGSLASFDTSSVLNTEGVPLLEESELEENLPGTGQSVASVDLDNVSFKLQSDITSIHS